MTQEDLTYKEITFWNFSKYVSLKALVGKEIRDIMGVLSLDNNGEPVFEMIKIIFQDDTVLSCEGEHDFVYLPPNEDQPNMGKETLLRLLQEKEKKKVCDHPCEAYLQGDYTHCDCYQRYIYDTERITRN